MKKDGYYSSGEFARMAHVTLRTVRYYDKQDILKPSLVTEFCKASADPPSEIPGLFPG